MNTLRDALISCAAHIVPPHLQAIAQLSDVELVGMADIATERGSARAAEAGCPCFTDYHALLAQTCPVVVVVCMLHPLHGPLA